MIRYEFLETVTSTNDLAKARAAVGEDEGLVIVANSQTGGRGTQGRPFSSPAETGVYFSLLLRPERHIGDILSITTQAAVAVTAAISAVCGIDCAIKPVNDIMLGGKKVGGILTETLLKPGTDIPDHTVIGIGLNLLTPSGGFPENIRDIAGAIFPDGAVVTRALRDKLVMQCVDNIMEIEEIQ